MSFLCGIMHRHNYKKDTSFIIPSPGQLLTHLFRIEKTSLLSGSMTVEAAVVLPCFLFFFMNLSSSLQMIALHGNLEYALHSAGNEICLYGSLLTDPMKELGSTGHVSSSSAEGAASSEHADEHADEEAGSELMAYIQGGILSGTYVGYRIEEELGEEYISSSPLRNGMSGLNFFGSTLSKDSDIVDIKLSYPVETPFDLVGAGSFYMAERFYGHLWNGYEIEGTGGSLDQEQIVYITEDSEVYHVTTSCTHLKLSVRGVEYADVPECRNNGGGRYSPCEVCASGDRPDIVYITSEGDRYHYSSECYTLTRTYSAVPLSDVEESHRPCSRCGG